MNKYYRFLPLGILVIGILFVASVLLEIPVSRGLFSRSGLLATPLVPGLPSLTTELLQSGVVAGEDNQANVLATTTEASISVVEVKASRTLRVVNASVAPEFYIGSCLVESSPGGDMLNCVPGWAQIDTYENEAYIYKLRQLTSISDPDHGLLAVSGSGMDAVFTAVDPVVNETEIYFSDVSGSGGVVSVVSIPGTIGIPGSIQVNTITPVNVEQGDIFTVVISVSLSVIKLRRKMGWPKWLLD